MTTTHKIEFESTFLFLLATATGIIMAFYVKSGFKQPLIITLPVLQSFQTPQPTLSPVPTTVTSSQSSPDGTKQITLTVTANKTLSKTYTFTLSNADGTNKQTIYTATYAADTMSIPFNAFSPDNMYVFLVHTTKVGSEALVMRADGQPLGPNDQYDNVAQLFQAKATGNTYQETTGWASQTLLIINTTAADGSKGPSYWFDVPSKAVIPLATEF